MKHKFKIEFYANRNLLRTGCQPSKIEGMAELYLISKGPKKTKNLNEYKIKLA